MDRWKTLPVVCNGGLILNSDALTQGTNLPGSAVVLQNFEPALEGGYRRILGHQKFDATEVTGDTGLPVLGVAVGLTGTVIACRYTTTGTDYALYKSVGAGWTKINTSPRTNVVKKMRGIISHVQTGDSLIICDGANNAVKYNGTVYTDINGTGAPANPKYAAIFINTLVLAGYSSDPSELSMSAPDTDTDFDGSHGAQTFSTKDTIMGIKTFRNELYIYGLNSIQKLTGLGTTDTPFQLVDVTTSIGCMSGDTIQELGGDLIFLAPDGFRSTAATSRIGDLEIGLVSQAIQPLVRTQLQNGFDETLYSGVVIRQKSQYRLYINNSAFLAQDQLGFLGKVNQAKDYTGAISYEWATIMGVQPYCATSAYTNGQEYAIIGSNNSGYVWRLEESTSFDGANIAAIYRSPDITFTDSTIRKVLQKAQIFMEADGDLNVTFKTYLDRQGYGVNQPPIQTLTQSGTLSTYGAAIYGSSSYGNISFPVFNKNLIGSAFVAAFEFSDTGINPSYRIDDFSIIFAPKAFR